MSYKLIRSNRKTIELSINHDMEIIVRAPLRISDNDINDFVIKHENWIEKTKIKLEQQKQRPSKQLIDEKEILLLIDKAKKVLPQRVEYFSGIMGVSPIGVKITRANTRWGSCSVKNSLCFSYKLMQMPLEIIDSVVVHELAHIRIKNHGKNFYNEILKYMPDYKERTKILKKM